MTLDQSRVQRDSVFIPLWSAPNSPPGFSGITYVPYLMQKISSGFPSDDLVLWFCAIY